MKLKLESVGFGVKYALNTDAFYFLTNKYECILPY